MMMMMSSLNIHTDGSCIRNPGPGGWAFVVEEPHYTTRSGPSPEGTTTNNRMELLAVINAMEFAVSECDDDRNINIYTDSQYVRNGVTKWMNAWERNGWVKRDLKSVKNADLWKRIHGMMQPNIQVLWERGHDPNNVHNATADRLAREGILQQHL